MIFSTVMSI